MSIVRPPDPDNPYLASVGLGLIGALIGVGFGIATYLPHGLRMDLVGGIAFGLIGLAFGLALGHFSTYP